MGCIVPSGIATDDTTKYFFQDLMETGSLASLYDFENRNAIFQNVHRSYKFCLITISGLEWAFEVVSEFIFFALEVDDLRDRSKIFTLSAEDIILLNPNTQTCPIFRSNRDAEITKSIYRQVPILIREGKKGDNPWQINFSAMFHMSNDSGLFNLFDIKKTSIETFDSVNIEVKREEFLPLYEAKMVHHFDHRWATYMDGSSQDVSEADKQNPAFTPNPRYWVKEWEVIERTTHIPRPLIESWKKGDDQTLWQQILYWKAGYHANRGDDKNAELILSKLQSATASVTCIFKDWIVIKSTEQQYPLSTEDFDIRN